MNTQPDTLPARVQEAAARCMRAAGAITSRPDAGPADPARLPSVTANNIARDLGGYRPTFYSLTDCPPDLTAQEYTAAAAYLDTRAAQATDPAAQVLRIGADWARHVAQEAAE